MEKNTSTVVISTEVLNSICEAAIKVRDAKYKLAQQIKTMSDSTVSELMQTDGEKNLEDLIAQANEFAVSKENLAELISKNQQPSPENNSLKPVSRVKLTVSDNSENKPFEKYIKLSTMPSPSFMDMLRTIENNKEYFDNHTFVVKDFANKMTIKIADTKALSSKFHLFYKFGIFIVRGQVKDGTLWAISSDAIERIAFVRSLIKEIQEVNAKRISRSIKHPASKNVF